MNPAAATHSSEYHKIGCVASGRRADGWSGVVRTPKFPAPAKMMTWNPILLASLMRIHFQDRSLINFPIPPSADATLVSQAGSGDNTCLSAQRFEPASPVERKVLCEVG